MNSNLILFDGISGSGKGSRINALEDYIKKEVALEVIKFAEPFYLREEIKEFRKNPLRDKRKELELFIKDRKLGLTYYEKFIGKKGSIILGDRSFISTMVYQSLQGIPLDEIKKLHEFYPVPDLAFILLCDPETAVARIEKRHKEQGTEISVSENLENIRILRQRYIDVASIMPYAKIINTNGRPEAIDLLLQSHINNYFGKPMQKAIFLDKDGTLVDNSRYPEVIPSDKIYEESFNVLKQLSEIGYKLFIVSSQPWVARGRLTLEEVENIFLSVKTQYRQKGIIIEDYGYCEHEREYNCPDKKPQTRLIENMVKKYNVDLTNSYMVGDMDDDVLAGKNIGLKTVRIKSQLENAEHPDYFINSIADLGKLLIL
ncbi:MAG: HAD-IIIA family hydrolase [Candidatus Nanoarchaeia archaeon]